MKRSALLFLGLCVVCNSVARAQTSAEKAPSASAQPAGDLANALAQRLSEQLHGRTVVGDPVKAGTVTLIPILLVDVNFAGASLPNPAGNAPGIDGFLMSGQARPLGFVAITPKGTRFIPAGNTPAK